MYPTICIGSQLSYIFGSANMILNNPYDLYQLIVDTTREMNIFIPLCWNFPLTFKARVYEVNRFLNQKCISTFQIRFPPEPFEYGELVRPIVNPTVIPYKKAAL